MARVYLRNIGSFKVLLTVEQTVGRGCPNRRDDVMLVQFFLKVATDGGVPSGGYGPPGQQPIKIDGIYGHQTQAYIDYYQAENSRRNPASPLKADGRVDPVHGKALGSVTQSVYTILALNVTFQNVRGPNALMNPSSDRYYPAAPTPSLYVS